MAGIDYAERARECRRRARRCCPIENRIRRRAWLTLAKRWEELVGQQKTKADDVPAINPE